MSTPARQRGPLLEASQVLGDQVRDQNATWLEPRPGPGGQALGASRRGVHGDGGDMPSTITRFALDALSRMTSSGAYSGESYQRRALSTLGNSSSTMRLGCQAPSRTSNFPPRTAKRPPYFSTVAGTSLRYSASPSSSCTSISTIT